MAGGKSTRFGSDKAFIEWQGMPLYLFQLQKLLRLNPRHTWLSTHPDQMFPDYIDEVTRINDVVADIGPIGALKTICEASSADLVQLLAIDMPLLEFAELPDRAQVPFLNQRWEPLAGCYPRKEILPLVDQQIAAENYSLQALLRIAEESGVIARQTLDSSSATTVHLYQNINTLEDLAASQKSTVDERTLLSRYRRDDQSFQSPEPDFLAREEPLEVRVNGNSVAVMMRTPGHDAELATGFLYTESVIETAVDIIDIEHCPDVDPEGRGNTLNVRLADSEANLDELTRHVFTSSSCGVCGKATIDSVFQSFTPLDQLIEFDPEVILSLPGKLRADQETFSRTGGLHASALFTQDGEMILLREDVGRHNALDKVIGYALREKLDSRELILLVSGRISFELMQKALAAKIPIVAGISAPSSLAVELARKSNVVLIGFLRERGFNLYSQSVDGK